MRYAVLALLLPALCSGEVTSRDLEVSQSAKDNEERFCSVLQGKDPVDAEAARATLQSRVGEGNLVSDILLKVQNPEDITEELTNEIPTLAFAAGGLVLAVLTLVVYLFCCWQWWNQCCCRCCRKERNIGKGCKLSLLICFGALCGGIVVAGLMAMNGAGLMVDGSDTMICGAARLTNKAINGHKDEKYPFVGLLPAAETFYDLTGLLDDNSAFLTQLKGILTDTAGIEQSLSLVSGTVAAMSDSMQKAKEVLAAGEATHLHECLMCNVAVDPLIAARKQIDDGAAKGLADARAEVDKQLSGKQLEDLRANLKEAEGPINDFKKVIVDNVGEVLGNDALDYHDTYVRGYGDKAPLALFVVGLPLVLGGLVSTLCLVLRPGESGAWHVTPARFASCTWCFGFLYAFVVLVVGGALSMTSFVLSGSCLLLDELSSSTLETYKTALELDFGSNEQMFKDIVDTCLTEKGDGRLAEVLVIGKACPEDSPDCSEEDKKDQTLRDMFDTTVKGSIDAAFDEMSKVFSGNTFPKLSENEQFTKLQRLAEIRIDALVLPKKDLMANAVDTNGAYSQMVSGDWRNAFPTQGSPAEVMGLGVASISSASCSSESIPTGIDASLDDAMAQLGLVNNVIPGVSAVRERVVTYKTPAQGATCDAVSCTPSSPSDGKTCTDAYVCKPSQCADAANCPCTTGAQFIADTKRVVREMTGFMCDVFTDRDGKTCDPAHQGPINLDGTYPNDCTVQNAAGGWEVQREPKSCTFPEWVQYMSEFSQRLRNTAERADEQVSMLGPKIDTELRALVHEEILDPTSEMLDGLNCKAIYSEYRLAISGFCYEMTIGFGEVAVSYLWLGLASLGMILVFYTVWRVVKDNISEQRKAIKI